MVDVEQHFLLLNVGVRLRSARIYNSRDVKGRTVDSEYSHLVTMTRILPQSPHTASMYLFPSNSKCISSEVLNIKEDQYIKNFDPQILTP